MAENVPGTPGFWQRFGAGLRAAPAGFAGGLRDYARRNFTREGWQEQLEGNPLQDATAVGRAASTALGGPPAIVTQFANSGLRGLGRGFMEAYRNAGLQNPGPAYGDTTPVRGTVSVGNINTDGSGVPYAINQTTGQVYQNNFPGLTGPYQHQPQVQQPVTLPQYSQPRPTTGLPGITSSLAGTGYGPSVSSPSGFAGNQGTSWNAASSASGGARLYGGNGFADNGTGTWDWRTFMIEQ